MITLASPVDFPANCEEYSAASLNFPLCPTWEAFLLEVMNGDQAKADYLDRLFGYGMTGPRTYGSTSLPSSSATAETARER